MDTELRFTDDLRDMDFDRVTALLADSPWCPGIGREEAEYAAQNSALAVAAYEGGRLVGYLRVISDTARFAYLLDVVVDPDCDGPGVRRGMLDYAVRHPRLRLVYQWLLFAGEAYDLYERAGFSRIEDTTQWLARCAARPDR